MDAMADWAQALAKAATPWEADLAPTMVRAFLAGGEARAEMLRTPGHAEVGAFGPPAAAMVFPQVLNGLALAAPLVAGLLAAAPHIKDFVAIVKDGLDIRDAVQRRRKAEALPDDPYAPLKRTLYVLDRELATTALDEGERAQVCYQVMVALLEDPDGSKRCVAALGAAAARS